MFLLFLNIQDKSDIIVVLKYDSILQKGDTLKENMFHGSNCKIQLNFKKFKHFSNLENATLKF